MSDSAGGNESDDGKLVHSSDLSIYASSAEESVKCKTSSESSVYKSSEECYEYSCDACKSAGENVEACGFCSDCKEYLCGTCFKSHSRSSATRDHILQDKDHMPKKAIKICDACKSVGEETEAVGYCTNCEEYLCNECFRSHSRSLATKHHNMKDKNSMPQTFGNCITRPSISNLSNSRGAVDAQTFTYLRDINVKTVWDEKDCYITGMTLVANNYLVLTDYNNKSLKLVDTKTNAVKDDLRLQSFPYGITTISPDQVAVVPRTQPRIQIISTSGGLTVVRNIKTGDYCSGIVFKNGKLFVSFHDPLKFQILQLTGEVYRTIRPDSEFLRYCNVPRHIAISANESLIYVSDWETNKVVCLDMNGNMVSKYQRDLQKPLDIILSEFGTVFLCNREQDSVCKISANLREATVVLGQGDGLKGPQAMCFNINQHHFFISSGNKKVSCANFIKVYRWK